MNKEELQKELLKKEHSLETDVVLVFNTYKNISKTSLIKTLDNLQHIVNRKINKRDKNTTSDSRIAFFHFPQIAHNNCHSHCIVRIPRKFEKKHVLDLIKDCFERLDSNYKVYCENVVKNKIANVIYTTRKFNRNDDESFVAL